MQHNIIGSHNWMDFLPQMQLLFDQLNDAVFIVNPKGEILILNQSASKLTGYQLSEMIGKPVETFFPRHPDISSVDLHRIIPDQPSSSPATMEIFPRTHNEIISKDGQKIPVEVTHIHFQKFLRNVSCIIVRNISQIILSDTLREINANLSSSLNLVEIFDLLLVELRKLIPYDGGNIMLVKNNNAHITKALGYEVFDEKLKDLIYLLHFEVESTENIKQIVNDQKPLIIPDTHTDPNWHHNDASQHFRSWIGVPIVINNNVEAIISLEKIEPNYFTEDHITTLSLFSNQAASAIKNASLYEEEVKRIQQLDGLQSTLAAINSQLELKTLLKEIVARSIDLLGASNGELAMYDPELHQLKILVSQNFHEEYSDQILQFNNELLNKVASSRKPIKIDRLSEYSELFRSMTFLGDHSGMAVPLLVGSKLLGVLAIADLETDKIFTDSDIELLNTFAQQATIAIHNSQLYEAANQRAEEAETMRKVGTVVTSSLNQGQAINSILEQLSLVIPYDSAAVLLQRKENLSVVGSRGLSALYQIQGKKLPLTSKSPPTDVYMQKQPMYISNMTEIYPEFAHELGLESEIQSWLGAPLIIKDRCLGILSLHSTEVDHFSKDHLRLIAAFADHVAIALENAQLYTDTARAADRFKALYQLSQIISTNIRAKDIYPSVHQAVSELMITEFFCISLYDASAQTITDVYMVDNGKPQVLTTRPLEKGLFSTVLKSGKSLLYHTFDATTAEEVG
ncbi:MAG: hypothetical protein C0410_12665, partial [Anaerolinea sp.]|nr:hypothetical protein [Anaerolinea sp.]